MAHNNLQLNYDELTSIAKQFKDQGEDIARLHSQTRQRVRDLYKEWEGEAAEKFFDEMETLLLPAVQRLAQALFLTQDTTSEIMKIIREADEETAGFFRNQLGGGDDFGAGKFGEALQGLPGGSSGGADDFGAGKFGEALGVQPPGGGSAPDDFGAGKFGEALGGDSSSTSGDSGHSGGDSSSDGGGGGGASDKKPKEKETPEVETEPTSGGGGGGSSSSSQGLQGDLKKMGTGLSDVVGQNASSGGGGSGGPAGMPDHVYTSSESSPKPDDAPIPSGNQTKPGVDSGSGESAGPKVAGPAAGAAGAAGAAAAGGAAKAVKGKAKKNNG